MAQTISEYMSPMIHFIGPKQSLTEAKALMEEYGIRHLPVIDAGEVTGMLTMSDLFVIDSLLSVDNDKTRVDEAMSKDVYTADAATPLAEVAKVMADRHIGSAVILRDGKPAGIFTATDGMRALAQILDSK